MMGKAHARTIGRTGVSVAVSRFKEDPPVCAREDRPNLGYRLLMRTLSLLLLGVLGSASGQTRPAVPTAACTTATEAARRMGHARRRPGAIDDLPHALARRTQRERPPRAHHGARNQPERRSLLLDRRVGGVSRGRAGRCGRDLAANRIRGGHCRDALAPNEVSWSCTGDSWRSGGSAASHPDLTSFDFVDAILKKLANKTCSRISAPSSSPDIPPADSLSRATRWRTACTTPSASRSPTSSPIRPATRGPMRRGRSRPPTRRPRTRKARGRRRRCTRLSPTAAFDASACPNYDNWPAGLDNRSGGYTAHIDDAQLKKAAGVASRRRFSSVRSTRYRSAGSTLRARRWRRERHAVHGAKPTSNTSTKSWARSR